MEKKPYGKSSWDQKLSNIEIIIFAIYIFISKKFN